MLCHSVKRALANRVGRDTQTARVLLIDDDAEFLDVTSCLLKCAACRIEVAGAFVSPIRAIAQLVHLDPNVALVDIEMPEMDGITCVRKIKEWRPETAVLMMTGLDPSLFTETALRSGACGLLTKPFQAEELYDAIHSATHGLTVFSNAAAQTFCQGGTFRRAALIREKSLNEREVQTLGLLAGFLENKEIADQLGVSIPVAEKILRNVFRKLGVRTRAEAIVIWRTVQ